MTTLGGPPLPPPARAYLLPRTFLFRSILVKSSFTCLKVHCSQLGVFFFLSCSLLLLLSSFFSCSFSFFITRFVIFEQSLTYLPKGKRLAPRASPGGLKTRQSPPIAIAESGSARWMEEETACLHASIGWAGAGAEVDLPYYNHWLLGPRVSRPPPSWFVFRGLPISLHSAFAVTGGICFALLCFPSDRLGLLFGLSLLGWGGLRGLAGLLGKSVDDMHAVPSALPFFFLFPLLPGIPF